MPSYASCTGYREYPLLKCTDDNHHCDLPLFLRFTGKGLQAGKELFILERIFLLASTGVGFGPGNEAVLQRLKAMTCQPLEKGENPLHGRRYPYVKMRDLMLAIVLFFRGIGKQQES